MTVPSILHRVPHASKEGDQPPERGRSISGQVQVSIAIKKESQEKPTLYIQYISVEHAAPSSLYPSSTVPRPRSNLSS